MSDRLRWAGIRQLTTTVYSPGPRATSRKVRGWVEDLRRAGLRRLVQYPENIDGAWVPTWVWRLLEVAPPKEPPVSRSRRQGGRVQAMSRREWLRVVVPVVEADVPERMAAAESVLALGGPVAVERWARGLAAEDEDNRP